MKSTMRVRRALIAAALTCSMGASVAACVASGGTAGSPTDAGPPKAGGTLRVAIPSIPPTIDPNATSLQAAWLTAQQACEGLYAVGNDFAIKPMLVDNDTYDAAAKTYTFTLRSGITFHDGSPLTATDAVDSINRFMQTPGNGAILKTLTESLTAVDQLTLRLVLKQPSAVVPTLLSTAYIQPSKYVRDRPISEPVDKLVCTGPYQVADYKADQYIKLTRFAGYQSRTDPSDGAAGAKHAYADEIEFIPTPDNAARQNLVTTGGAEVAQSLPLDNLDTLKSTAGAQAVLSPPITSSTVVLNEKSGPMANLAMRQAFQAALNMSSILQAAFGNPDAYGVDGSIIQAPNKQWHSEVGTDPYNKPDLAKVKALLAQAGYHGEKIRWLTTQDDPTWYGPALPAQQQLKDAGINVELVTSDLATLISRRNNPDQWDVFSSGIPTYADPLLLPYLQDSFPGWWTDAQKNSLLTRLATETDQTQRKAAWEQLQSLVYTQVPFLKFGDTRVLFAASTKVHGLENQTQPLYFNVWMSS